MGEIVPASLTLATFNMHMGVDGWGRPYDVAGQCRALDADVLVLQESWAPEDGSPSTAERIASAVGYDIVAEVALARGKLFSPHPSAGDRWGPSLSRPARRSASTGSGGPRPMSRGDRSFARGRWGMAVLARIPVHDVSVIPLGKLRRDPARRALIRCIADLEGGPLTILGTHMAHITHGSHAQYRLLGTKLPPVTTAAVLTGDMNLWGPAGELVRPRVAAGDHRQDLAGPAPAQPARPHDGHTTGIGARGPYRRVRRLRPSAGGGHPGRDLSGTRRAGRGGARRGGRVTFLP